MDKEEIIRRLKKISEHAIHVTGEPSFIISLDDGIALNKAISLLKEQKAVVRCKNCKHRPKEPNFGTYESGFDLEFPEGSKCPCQCSGDEYYSWYPKDNWFYANGERK